MKALYIALLIFLHPFNLFAQWHWQNPTPFGNGLSEIQFLNVSIGYACGSGGTVIKTFNGGKQWIQLETGTDNLIIDIFFLSEEIGWFITYNERTIYKTTNGGIEWNLISNLSPNFATSIWFVNEMKGFAGGDQYLLKTTDGGFNWYEITSIYEPYALYFLDSNIGFVGGINVLYKTIDGGLNWDTIFLPGYISFFKPTEIKAFDNSILMVVGNGYDYLGNDLNLYLKSFNGGDTWSSYNFSYYVSDIYFKTNTDGWVCSDKIYKTTTSGNNWEPSNHSGYRFEFFDNDSWAISGWNLIIHSNDFWITADQQINSVFSGFLWSGAAKDTNTIFACGSNKTIIGSVNGGKTWSKYFEATDQTYLNAVTFNNDDIWAVGNDGVVLHSTNYGNIWEEESINASGLRDIEFINDSLGYIVGTIWGLACIYTTQDGGKSWELQQTFPEYFSIDRIEFAREDLGWMIAYSNGLLKSTDFGRTWNVIVDSIYFFGNIATSGDTAWFSYNRNVLRTTNAGLTWESFNVFDYQGINFGAGEIDFINSTIGYLATYDGRIFSSNDGGTTWTEEDFPSAMPVFAIDFIDANRGWTFGESGTILKRDPNYVFIENELVHPIKVFFLSQNFPNPFNPTTTIRFTISELRFTTLKIYNVLGREVATLINEEKPAGNYEVEFSAIGGSASGGNAYNLSSGIYFYRLQAGEFAETKKMVLLK
jgi:photosystem II stability/assembly factor-like uncharacterized protein